MEPSLKRTDVNRNIVKLLLGREKKASAGRLLQLYTQFTEALIKRLGLEYELEGHHGCVNCLEWSLDGRFLASGSDDTRVIIWDPFSHRLLKKLPTPHVGNIFSVKFLGNDGSFVASGAGDCRVIVQSIEQATLQQGAHLDCSCHIGRVKRLATTPDEPLLLWSAGEDGLVLQYDMREPHECCVKSKLLIDLSDSVEIKCITVNPVKSYLMAVGANDCFVRLYDRRMLKISNYKPSPTSESRRRTTQSEPIDPRCVQYYAPGHLTKLSLSDMNYKLAATYVAFNASGTDLLVNMGGEQVYLFDINNPRYVRDLQVPGRLLENKFPVNNKYNVSMDDNGLNPTVYIQIKKLMKYNKQISENPCACDYLERAKILFQRKWTGDIYSAARDYLCVLKKWPDMKEAYVGLIRCLLALYWTEEAHQWLKYFEDNYHDLNDKSQISSLYKELTTAKDRKTDSEYQEIEKTCSEEEKQLRLASRDFEVKFLGHCNTTTDIKEANFLGEDGQYICAGSDDGVIFIWDRKSSNIVNALWGDISIVNCVQPHPSACLIATSGIDSVVKLWSPVGEGVENKRIVLDPWAAVEANQHRMQMDPFETMLVNMGYRFNTTDMQDIPTCQTS